MKKKLMTLLLCLLFATNSIMVSGSTNSTESDIIIQQVAADELVNNPDILEYLDANNGYGKQRTNIKRG